MLGPEDPWIRCLSAYICMKWSNGIIYNVDAELSRVEYQLKVEAVSLVRKRGAPIVVSLRPWRKTKQLHSGPLARHPDLVMNSSLIFHIGGVNAWRLLVRKGSKGPTCFSSKNNLVRRTIEELLTNIITKRERSPRPLGVDRVQTLEACNRTRHEVRRAFEPVGMSEASKHCTDALIPLIPLIPCPCGRRRFFSHDQGMITS